MRVYADDFTKIYDPSIGEAEKLGFKQIIIPKANTKNLDHKRFSIEIRPVSKVEEAFRELFG